MNIAEILYKLIIGPIELLFDVIFSWTIQFLGSPGAAIVVLSLAINLLVLPLYKKADALQQQENETAKRLKPRIDQIREAFTGDERFMILQTFYRQNHYKPYYVLRGSLSLLLQIPFFMAAYNFLSDLSILRRIPFGPIENLALPDGLLTLGGLTVNVLPILMTLINIVSGMIYTRGQPLKSKIQLYGMALVFLVLLYGSPSGLVLYWTLNNVFSLGKNIFGMLLKKPAKSLKKAPDKTKDSGKYTALFLTCCVLLTVLTGLLIPSAVIRESPEEFVEMNAFRSPLVFVLHAFLLAAGTFMIWSVIYYLLTEKKRRPLFCLAFVFLALAAVVNYMFFGNGYGNMSSRLVYDIDIREHLPMSQVLMNAGALLVLAGAVVFLWRKKAAILRVACTLMALVITGMSLVNIVSVGNRLPEVKRLAAQQQAEREKFIRLDRDGENVIVLMLDRACGCFMPFVFEEKPELKDQFAGFVCYSNTLSFGDRTHNGAPALFGGYEYTPEKMCKRTDETLMNKAHEALRLMPRIFLENGYEVTVCDPPTQTSPFIPDLSIYDDLEGIRTYFTEGAYPGSAEDETKEGIEERNRVRERNLFCYSVFRSSPLLLHRKLYQGGNYNRTEKGAEDYIFHSKYQVLESFPDNTVVQEEGRNRFLMITNNLTHQPQILQEPDYVPAEIVDNTQYDLEHPSRFSADGREMQLSSDSQIKHYHVNMAAMILIGRWLDSLRESGVYDNTRIILVGDHGITFDDPNLEWEEIYLNIGSYNPLLMVKDFNCRDPFTFSDEFMTNADTPTIAFDGLIDNPVNPATGVPVRNEDKQADEHVICSCKGNYDSGVETVYPDARYYMFKNRNVMDLANWSLIGINIFPAGPAN